MSKHMFTMCSPDGNTGCPKVFVNSEAHQDQIIEITDDFSGKIAMSEDQFNILIKAAKSGKLDQLTRK